MHLHPVMDGIVAVDMAMDAVSPPDVRMTLVAGALGRA